jgi:hypothetical protein
LLLILVLVLAVRVLHVKDYRSALENMSLPVYDIAERLALHLTGWTHFGMKLPAAPTDRLKHFIAAKSRASLEVGSERAQKQQVSTGTQ